MPSNKVIGQRYRRLQEIVKELKGRLKEDTAPAELEILRRENKALRQKLRVGGGVTELLIATTRDAIADWDGKLTLPPPVDLKGRSDEEVVALAHLTDIQLGKVTATYSTEIAEGRMMEYAQKVVRCCHVHNKQRKIRELHVYMGGDMVEGDGTIFPKQQFSIDSSVLEQAVINGPRIFSAVLMYWTSYFDIIKVSCVRGNHGRSGKKHDDGHPGTNWDTVLYHCTKQMVDTAIAAKRDSVKAKIEWKISDSWYVVDEILGHRNLLVHGDLGIRGGFAGIPFYGITKAMAGWLDVIPEPWDNTFVGHFHQFLSWEWNGHKIYIGGTPESDNEFARAELAAGGRPKQRLQLWTRKNGPIVDLPILLNYGYEPRLPYSHRRGPALGAV